MARMSERRDLWPNILCSLLLVATLAIAPQAWPQAYPAKPIKVLVAFAPGGTVDITVRIMQRKLTEELGQPLIIENHGGAGGTIATAMAAKSPADGYTLLVNHQGLAFNATLYTNLPYDTLRDLVPIAAIGSTPNVMVVNPSLPIHTVQEFLAMARASPGALAYGSGGVGSAGHLAVELLQSLASVKLTHVPYKGSGPALSELVAGQIQTMVITMPAVISFVKSGKVRAIATSGAKRSPAMPDLPTIAESGVPGYEYMPWYGWFGPSGLPKPVVARLNQAVNKVLEDAAIRDQLSSQGLEVETMTAAKFADVVRADVAHWGKIIRDLGIRVD